MLLRAYHVIYKTMVYVFIYLLDLRWIFLRKICVLYIDSLASINIFQK